MVLIRLGKSATFLSLGIQRQTNFEPVAMDKAAICFKTLCNEYDDERPLFTA